MLTDFEIKKKLNPNYNSSSFQQKYIVLTLFFKSQIFLSSTFLKDIFYHFLFAY